MPYDVTVFSGEQVFIQGEERGIMMNFTDNTIHINGVCVRPENFTKFFRMAQLFADGDLAEPGGPIHVK